MSDVIQEFRNDHRWVRDHLISLSEAITKKDIQSARKILADVDSFIGPHFRFEEEAMYPALKKLLGEYINQLISEHDEAIATARACADLLSKDSLSDKEAEEAAKAARALLVHVSNCDGLAILSERLSEEELSNLSAELERCRKDGVSLLKWADTIRKGKH